MTVNSIAIKHYQSHDDTNIELGDFTVIVGPSSSGKSAITRAIKALTSNQTGKDFITHGENTCQISMATDKGTVVLTKGKPEDSYVLLRNDDPQNPRRFTKLAGSVPEEVSAFLGIAPKDALNYAGQFDMPFLLKTSASEVARTLGELTNVSSIFEASREALRRKQNFASTLKVRQTDEANLLPRISSYDTLDERLSAIHSAEEHLRAAHNALESRQRLNDTLATLQTARLVLKAAEGRTASPLPDVSTAKDIYDRQMALNATLSALKTAKDALTTATTALSTTEEELTALHEEYTKVLVDVGTCPTCGQGTEELHSH